MITLNDFCVRYMPSTDEHNQVPVNYTAPQKHANDVQIHHCRDGWKWLVREFGYVDIQSDISFPTAQEALEHLLRCDIDFVQETLAATVKALIGDPTQD